MALAENEGLPAQRLKPALATIDQLIRRAQSEMRRFIFEWGPEGIGDGLVPALTRHVSSLSREGTLHLRVEGPEEPLPLTRATETQLFGIGREAVANVVKHAHATSACVRIETKMARVVLEVEDDGLGFETGAAHDGHFGLDSMRSRADEIGAELQIDSTPGSGTIVRVELATENGRNGA
jgi:signal transduction histidine kinase